ncbi:MAG: aspartate kinase [Deltaproteobacteria bacterium]|nr:aspartate kinase [Deltaproteobacteria bacterium]MBI4196551.1 aspartate kinase [Deltaproteobacteria bacterium]
MLVVQKYGGTSVAGTERIRNVAERVRQSRHKGNKVVVILSAMAGETNRLVDLAKQVSKEPDGREYDQLVSTGEQVTIALLALTLQSMGVPARSFLGHQVRLLTDSSFSKARIKSIDAEIIHKELNKNTVVVIAGFQGTDPEGNITTLGRGGSDTTAVAIAAALKADACEIYTDVDGVYTADPRVCPEARLIPIITYEEMLELASSGAKVLQSRSVELAANYRVPVWVKSAFLPVKKNGSKGGGTLVTNRAMEEMVVSGIAHDRNEAKVAVRGLADRPGVAARLFAPLAKADINVDMIVQNISEDGYTDLTFTVSKIELPKALRIMHQQVRKIGAQKIEADEKIAKVSIVGVGMKSHAGVASRMFETLAREGVNIQMISTSEIKVSVVIREAEMEKAVRALHKAFGLGKK